MAIIVHFNPTGLTADTYAETMRRLAAAGEGAPRGRLHHACYGTPDALRVVDIYATPQDFEEFGSKLMPILGALGVDPGQPLVHPVIDLVRAG
ncbi:MAG: hypothetical protein NVSMB47_04480 [Polyangiales bacterium]